MLGRRSVIKLRAVLCFNNRRKALDAFLITFTLVAFCLLTVVNVISYSNSPLRIKQNFIYIEPLSSFYRRTRNEENIKTDWNDYSFEEIEAKRVGPGEQGSAVTDVEPDEEELNQRLFDENGYTCYQKTRFICEDSELLLKEVLEIKDDPVEDDTQTNAEVVPRSTRASTTKTTTKKPESLNEKTERRIEPVDSTIQPRRRKVVRKKLPQKSDTEKRKNETIEENNETTSTTMAPTSTEAVTDNVDVVDRNEKFDARVEEAQSEEVETTTITEAPDTTRRPSRGRGRQRRPLN